MKSIRIIIPAFMLVAITVTGCKKNCQECYVIGEGPFINDYDTIDNDFSRRPFGVMKSRTKCQELADSLNSDNSAVYNGVFEYTYYCSCNMEECD